MLHNLRVENMGTAFCLSIALLAVACGPGVKFQDNIVEKNTSLAQPVIQDSLECLQKTPDFQLNTSIDSFLLKGGASGNAGFNPGGLLQLIGVNVTYSSGELDMSMGMTAPLYGQGQIANATGLGMTNNFSISTSGLIGLVTGNAGAWQSTGLYDASVAAVGSSFNNLKKNLPALPKWSTVITKLVGEGNYLVPVGTLAGLKAGDRFDVFKVEYQWQGDGAPCSNPLKMAYKTSGKAIAMVEVQQVDLTTSAVNVVKAYTNETIGMYDVLEINKLVPTGTTARTQLEYSLKIGALTVPANLVFSDGRTSQAVDMRPFVRAIIEDLLANKIKGYYLM